MLSAIGDYILEALEEEVDEDDPLYLGIIDVENIKNKKTSLFQKLKNLNEWKQLNEIGIPIKEMLFNQKNIKAWL